MKPTRQEIQAVGSLPGEKIAMGFDETATQHLLAVMTDLYSDPELAILREYATNALDSHVEAGNSDPIRVQTPTALSPFLVIEDRGVGLNVDDVHNIYSKYGASTKRDSNEAVGMLGLGCKSALTYTTQFTVTAVKDGVRTQVAISRDEDGGGTMTIVDTSATTEPNGVTVKIPAKHVNSIEKKARAFFKFWRPGTVLLNGAEPEHHDGLSLSESIMLCKGDYYTGTTNYVVMGNVGYPVKRDHMHESTLGLPTNYYIIARVPIGAVHFTPSREELHYTAHTKRAIERVIENTKAALADAIQKEIDAAPTRADAVNVFVKWREVARNLPRRFTRKGETIPSQLTKPDHPKQNDGESYKMFLTSSDSYQPGKADKARSIDLAYFGTSVFVTGYEPEKFTPNHKHKLRKWAEDEKLSVRSFVLIDFPLPADVTKWIDANRIIDWPTIKAIQLPRKQALVPGGRIPGSYDLIRVGKACPANGRHYTDGVPGDEIDFTHPVFWFHGNYHQFSAEGVLSRFYENYTVVLLSANRIEKFKRDAPKAVMVQDEIQSLAKKWATALTPRQKEALWLRMEHPYDISEWKRLAHHRNRFKDPEVKALLDATDYDATKLTQEYQYFRPWVRKDEILAQIKNPFNKYPLYSASAARAHVEHLVLYMNAAFDKGI